MAINGLLRAGQQMSDIKRQADTVNGDIGTFILLGDILFKYISIIRRAARFLLRPFLFFR